MAYKVYGCVKLVTLLTTAKKRAQTQLTKARQLRVKLMKRTPVTLKANQISTYNVNGASQ
jgi:hypothetical protein